MAHNELVANNALETLSMESRCSEKELLLGNSIIAIQGFDADSQIKNFGASSQAQDPHHSEAAWTKRRRKEVNLACDGSVLPMSQGKPPASANASVKKAIDKIRKVDP